MWVRTAWSGSDGWWVFNASPRVLMDTAWQRTRSKEETSRGRTRLNDHQMVGNDGLFVFWQTIEREKDFF